MLVVGQRVAFRRHLDGIRLEGFAHWNRLGPGRCLTGFLGHGDFFDPNQWLTVDAIEEIDPTGLVKRGNRLARHALNLNVEQHDRRG